jgi:hypothetical protein
MKPTIWLYWENKGDQPEPEMVRRSKEIFRQYENVIILNNTNIEAYITGLVDCSRLEFVAQKVDYYRAKLLYEYGGIWIDMDAILLDDMADLWTQFINSNYEACCEYEGSICNIQVLFFKPKSVIAEAWYKRCEKLITSGVYIDWATLGGIALGHVIHENNWYDKLMILPGSAIWSFGWENKQYEAYYNTDPKFIVDHLQAIRERKPKVIMLYGTFMYKLPIPEHCLLEQMWKMATLPRPVS